MPKVTKIGEQQSEKQTITKEDVGTVKAEDLLKANPNPPATTTNSGSGQLAVPDWLKQSNMPVTDSGKQSNYVGFASVVSGNWNLQQLSGCKDGQPYLFRDGGYIPLEKFEFFICQATSFYTMVEDSKQMRVLFAERMEDVKADDPNPHPYSGKGDPTYIILMIVNVNGTLIPIRGDFRGTKSGGLNGAIRAVEAAGTPNWAKMSEAHKVSTMFPHPFGRVYHSITMNYAVSKTNGNPYWATKCVSRPSGVDQIQLLINSMNDSRFIRELEKAKEQYDVRVEFLDKVNVLAAQNPQTPQVPQTAGK